MPPLFMYSSWLKSRTTAVAPFVDREAVGRPSRSASLAEVTSPAIRRIAAGPVLVELDDGGGHAASPSTISMKSDRRVIRKISR